MNKAISILLTGLLFISYNYSQQKPFGYKISGNGDIVSDVFIIQEGFVLDSIIIDKSIAYRAYKFEYYENGKLKRDINMKGLSVQEYVNNHIVMRYIPTCYEYFYNEQGLIDSAKHEVWYDTIWAAGSDIRYSYDNNGNLLSKIYVSNSDTLRVEENHYDLYGNLIFNKIILTSVKYTTCSYREYDSQDRLIKINTSYNPYYHADQIIYHYDSLKNITCTFQDVDFGDVRNLSNHFLIFDESGKVEKEIKSRMFNSADSTWLDTLEILFNYNENDRISKIGMNCWFGYNSEGNIDSILDTHPTATGYLSRKGTLIDYYGNIIALPVYNYTCQFFYSRLDESVPVDNSNNHAPVDFSLKQNYPNPFNPTTVITYSLPKSSFVALTIYDLLGREVTTLVNEEKHIGTYEVIWNARDISSGVYFYKINAGEFSKINKMLLLK